MKKEVVMLEFDEDKKNKRKYLPKDPFKRFFEIFMLKKENRVLMRLLGIKVTTGKMINYSPNPIALKTSSNNTNWFAGSTNISNNWNWAGYGT